MVEAPLSPLEYALAYAAAGFAVFPCKPGGKEPLTKHGHKDAARGENQIRRWWTRRPNANVGIATGAPSGLVVVDIDSVEGAELLVGLTKRFGQITPTHSVVTGKGRHYYFKLPQGCGAIPSSAEGGLDIRADGGYVVAPPSIHPDGGVYRWDASSPNEMAFAPRWLLDFARNRKGITKPIGGAASAEGPPRSKDGRQVKKDASVASQSGANGCHGVSTAALANTSAREAWTEAAEARLRSALAAIPADDRDVWVEVGGVLHDLAEGDPRWPGRGLWDDWSRSCPEKFNPATQETNWASFARDYDGTRVTIGTIYHFAREAGWSDPASALTSVIDEAPPIMPKRGVDFAPRLRTDANNALMFLDLFGEDLRFVEKWGCWLAWDGSRWVEVSDLALLPLARQATEEMLRWAAAQPSSNGDREAWIKHAIGTQKDKGLRAMIGLAKGEARARIEPDALDGDPWLLGCPNGTLDLRSGSLREARREDFVTKQISVPFDPGAECPHWTGFLDWAMQGDSELVEFLKTLAGYVLTGEVREELLCALVGGGANGKSTFLMTLCDLMGDYAGKARSDLLVSEQGTKGAASPDVAAIQGKRLVVVNETEDGCLLSEARVKDIVSNEAIPARRLYRDPFTFRPTHKTILATNHRPRVRGTDHGIWRRLALVPFNATVEEADKVADFRERVLRPELPGILNWAVQGCLSYGRDGLRQPSSVRQATAAYRADMDTVSQWIDERTEREPAASASLASLFADYASWADLEHTPHLGACPSNAKIELRTQDIVLQSNGVHFL